MPPRKGARANRAQHPPAHPAAELIVAEVVALRGLLLRFGVAAQDARDVEQEIALGAIVAIRSGRFRPDPTRDHCEMRRVWLVGIAVRVISHYRGKAFRRREVSVTDPWSHVAEPTFTPVDWLEASAALCALWTLPLWARETLLLAAVGHGVTEIARLLRVPVSTAAARMRRARRLLLESLAQGLGQ